MFSHRGPRSPTRRNLGLAFVPRLTQGFVTHRNMVRKSLDALIGMDANLARVVLTMDDEIDDLNREMYTTLQDLMRQSPEFIDRAVHTLSVSRYLERIADLATNIAEDVVFMVEGELIRHQAVKNKE